MKHTRTTPLPQLSIASHGETVIMVMVQDAPVAEGRGQTVWVVDEEPARRLGNGQLIQMANKSGHTGPGLLTAITGLHRHWITWSISGGPEKAQIRIPVPWTAMTGVEAIAHAKHFRSLPAIPAPHRQAPPPTSSGDETYPYHRDLDKEEQRRLEERLEAITKRKWEWKPEAERKRRRTAPIETVNHVT